MSETGAYIRTQLVHGALAAAFAAGIAAGAVESLSIESSYTQAAEVTGKLASQGFRVIGAVVMPREQVAQANAWNNPNVWAGAVAEGVFLSYIVVGAGSVIQRPDETVS